MSDHDADSSEMYLRRDKDKSFHDGDEGEPDTPEEWGLNIVRVDNGFIANGIDGTAVFEDADNCEKDIDPEALARLLYHVIEYFGASGSRYDARRVRVVVEPGDKYEGPTPIIN